MSLTLPAALDAAGLDAPPRRAARGGHPPVRGRHDPAAAGPGRSSPWAGDAARDRRPLHRTRPAPPVGTT
ncbi:hypothetical protein QJS66_13115 [Kocuria rhizophila]|nr:hypothetical protein QJS66_13115 [Kocuria rhizophila]